MKNKKVSLSGLTRQSIAKIPVYFFLILGSLIMVFPFIWMILTSL